VKGGNAAKFEQIYESYFVLNDHLRRRAYDMQFNIINESSIVSKLFRGYAYSMLSDILFVYSSILFIISLGDDLLLLFSVFKPCYDDVCNVDFLDGKA
jgi:hypothetical protein